MALTFEKNNFCDAMTVRTAVFVEEQGFNDEFDDIDNLADTIHVTAYDNEVLAGCSRVFPDPDQKDTGRWIFGRLAVLPHMRKGGLGASILAESEKLACKEGAKEIHLHAQCRVEGFYERCGYTSYGPIELDEHVEHIWMYKAM